MDSEVQPPEDDREVELALEASGLRDEVEAQTRRMRATLGAGVAIAALFVVAGAFMEHLGSWFDPSFVRVFEEMKSDALH